MWIERLLRQTKELKPKDGDPEHKIQQESKVYLVGVECHWWVDNDLRKGKFHSMELVPYHVARSGDKAVEAWMNDR